MWFGMSGGVRSDRRTKDIASNSWIDAGFRVLSANFPQEIPELAARYPQVHFVAVNRDASAILGRKTPLLGDLLEVLAEQDEEIVGIINADIFLEAKDWAGVVRKAVRNGIAIAHRANVTRFDDSSPELYRRGYDLFFFQRKTIPAYVARPFALGLPWWDYYLPMTFKIRGLEVELINSPIAFHLDHPMHYDWGSWQHMANEFAEFILESARGASRRTIARRHLAPVIRLCRKIVAEPPIYLKTWDRLLASTGRLPILWRLRRFANGHGRQEATRFRLCKACVHAFSPSSATADRENPIGAIRASILPSSNA